MVDEAWSLLGNEHFAGTLASWAREMRKLKAALVLATQSLADLQKEDDAGDQRPDREQHLPAAAGGDAARDAAALRGGRAHGRADPAAGHRDAEGRVPPADGGADPAGELPPGRRRAAAVRRVLAGATSRGRGRCWREGVRPGEEFCRAWLGRTTRGVAAPSGASPSCTRRSRAWTTDRPPSLLREVLARHGWRCCLCGRPCRDGDVWRHSEARLAGERPGQLLGDVRRLRGAMVGKGAGAGPVRRARPRARPRVAPRCRSGSRRA